MKKLCLYIASLLCLGILAGQAGTISGKLIYEDSSAANGEVSFGVISDPNNPLLTALSNILSTGRNTQRITLTDANGNYQLTNVPEQVDILVAAVDDKSVHGPTMIKTLQLSPGQTVPNVNFVFPVNYPRVTKLQGTVTLNGQPLSSGQGGLVNVVKTDKTVGKFDSFESDDGGQYKFEDLPPGEYTLRADFEKPDGTAVHTSTNVTVPATGSITVNVNILTQ